MQIRVFTIPVCGGDETLSEMNRFLAANKVLEVEQRFSETVSGGSWSFCIRTLGSVTASVSATSFSNKERVDYKKILSEDQFDKFGQLRAIRKQIAVEKAVPAYAVFTDEELAGIAKLDMITESSMQTIPGIGAKKVENYGKQLCVLLQGG